MCQYIPFFSSWACSDNSLDNSSDDSLVSISKGKKRIQHFTR